VEVLRQEGIDAIRYALWDATGLPRYYIPRLEESNYRGTERVGWEMAVRIEKIFATVLHEAHERQVEEVMETLSERPENFYSRYLDR
jgi:hypothetical protein